jgi:carboxylesterase
LLQQRLGGLVHTLVLDDSYHVVTIDRQRDLVNETLVDFACNRARKAGIKLASEQPLGEKTAA